MTLRLASNRPPSILRGRSRGNTVLFPVLRSFYDNLCREYSYLSPFQTKHVWINHGSFLEKTDKLNFI